MANNKQSLSRKSKAPTQFWNMPLALNDILSDNFGMDFDKFFNHFHARPLFFPRTISTSCDIEDLGKELLVKVDLPGVTKKDIKLDISENSIEISAEHKDESENKRKNFLKRNAQSYHITEFCPYPSKSCL